MSDIYREVTVTEDRVVGFQCGICKTKYRTRSIDGIDWPYAGSKGYISFDPNDDMGPPIHLDFCHDCWGKISAFVKDVLGGRFENDGSS